MNKPVNAPSAKAADLTIPGHPPLMAGAKDSRNAAPRAGMTTVFGRPGLDWTVVLRRQPARIVAGQAEGGYTDMFEIICCDCGDDPGLDYGEVSPWLQRTRGPYPIAAGVAAYEQHLKRHPNRQAMHQSDRQARDHGASDRSAHPPARTRRGDRGLKP